MRLILHPKVYSDIDEIMRYYERIATPELADDFYRELRHYMKQAERETGIFLDSGARHPPRELIAVPLSFLVSYRWRCRSDPRCAPPQQTAHSWCQAPIISSSPQDYLFG